MKATGKHRDRKNGASREQWQKRKQAANALRPKQVTVTTQNGEFVGPSRDASAAWEPATPLD